jgi:hypothetical protein
VDLLLTTRWAWRRVSNVLLYPYRAFRSPLYTLARLLNWNDAIPGIGDSVVTYAGSDISPKFSRHRAEDGELIVSWRGYEWIFSPWRVAMKDKALMRELEREGLVGVVRDDECRAVNVV